MVLVGFASLSINEPVFFFGGGCAEGGCAEGVFFECHVSFFLGGVLRFNITSFLNGAFGGWVFIHPFLGEFFFGVGLDDIAKSCIVVPKKAIILMMPKLSWG